MRTVVGILGAMLAVASFALVPKSPAPPGHDWPRFGYDIAGTNAPATAMGLTPAKLGALRRDQIAIDGTVDASAIYLHAVSVMGGTHDAIFVTTTYGKTIALDADGGRVLWEFTPPSYDDLKGSSKITTATPVADPDRSAIYAASPDGMVQKLKVEDGSVVWRTPVTRLPKREKIASALNFDRGHVVAVTGGYIGDAAPYQGHVAILDAANGALAHVWNSLCSDRHELIDPSSCGESGSAIWGRTGAVIDASTGDLFVATGNGKWDGRTNWGDAIIELDPSASRILGNYTPSNTSDLEMMDADLGSTSPVLAGNGIVIQGGKDEKLRVVDWSRMRGDAPHQGGESQAIATPGNSNMFTSPAVLRTDTGTWIFAADNGGAGGYLLQGGRLRAVWHARDGGTSPVLADGLLLIYGSSGGLDVYEPFTGRHITQLEAGEGHWNSPIVADGRIILPEGNSNSHKTSGVIDIWH